jgi:glutathione synthase/RimK-type ligase-like ATP-grasp enzyme
MIVVSGLLADEMIELMCARLNALGMAYTFFDELHYPGRYDVTWEADRGDVHGHIDTPEGRIDLADITGVYVRYVDYRGEPQRTDLTAPEKEVVKAEYQLSLMDLYDCLPCPVVNRARSSTSNDSKVYQQQVAREYGFHTPQTLITTIPDEVVDFYERCERRVIYKSVSGVRSIVKRLSEDDFPRLTRVQNCPTQFQQWIEGVDVRVHTVGNDVFATEIVSDASDYRYASLQDATWQAQAVEIPEAVADMCVALSAACDLPVAGIDLRRTPDGRYFCFEVNPSPAFVFYERAAGQPISAAVARLLAIGA